MSGRALVVEQRTERGTVLEHRVDVRDAESAPVGDGAVTIDVAYSDLNYKDALAVAGRPGVLRASPIVPGIDLVGTVAASDDPRWNAGDRVILTGDGLGESLNGGYSARARVCGDALVRLPGSLSPARAAAIGTAGFTAMLSVLALEDQGVAAGSVAVSGSTGGVGSIAVAVLAARGYEVTALTGRVAEHGELLTRLGAAHVVDRSEVSEPGRPLQTARWAGVVDAVGGVTLANLIAQTERGGTVTACGLAQSPELPASVLPFILRGVKLVGIDSVEASPELRERAWSALAAELDLGLLDELTTTIGLDAVPGAADALLAGRMSGRTVVEVNRLAE